MFQEFIARRTAEHFREHVDDYILVVRDKFAGSDKLTLSQPEITHSTLVGGIMQAELDRLPIIGVDCVDKAEIPSNESLYYCRYDGAFAGLVSASSSDEVDKLCKRYATLSELYVKDHQFLHAYETDDFTFREFYYVNTSMSGAMEVELEEQQPIWIAGFTMNVQWVTSEDQGRQH
jgi:hypothetical protein